MYKQAAPSLWDNNDEMMTFVKSKFMSCLDIVFKPLLKGNNVTISFRVNKAHEKDFQRIYEEVLPIYNMDFSALLRSLLTFYIINRLAIRERFLHFKAYSEISNAIIEEKQCLIFLKKEKFLLSCMLILVSPISDRNVLLGIEHETGRAHAIPFQLVTNAIMQNEDGIAIKSKLKIIRTAFSEYIKVEKKLQNC